MHSTQRSGLLLIVLAAGGYSFFAIFTKYIYDHGLTNPLDILTWRFVLSTPLVWGVVAAVKRRQPAISSEKPLPRGALLLMGILFAVVAGSAFFALSRLPVSLYTVLLYTYPTMVALGARLLGERLSWRGWVALVMTTLGIILTVPNVFSGFGGIDPVGVLFIMVNAVTYAAYILISSRILRGHQNLMQASAWSVSGSLVFVIGLVMVRGAAVPANIETWGGLLALVSISTVIPIIAFYSGMAKIGASQAAIVSTLEPVLTLIWAGLLLGERLQTIQIIGAAFIIASVILLQLRQNPRTAEIVSIANEP